MTLLHSSTRRPAALKDTDYDHEIILVDHTIAPTPPPPQTRSPSREGQEGQAEDIERFPSPVTASDSSSRRYSDVPLRKNASKKMRQQVARRKYGKFKGQTLREGEVSHDEGVSGGDTDGRSLRESTEEIDEGVNGHANGDTENRGRARNGKKQPDEEESAIDIMYENERGGFLCGIPLFSSKALGNLDPAAWTNCAQKTSATNITNAQVPDPSWQWAWKDWSINHTDEVDENGWEYSFAFAKQFSWHSAKWWNSFVRRRAWTRKRVKKHAQPRVHEAHMLNADYFTIHPVVERSRSRSTNGGTLHNRYSVAALAKQEMEQAPVLEDITDIPSLMKALKLARIDREKLEAVENFIEHGEDELYYLRDKMHEVMGMFIFQASRKLLLEHLLKILNDVTEQQKADVDGEQNPDPAKVRRLDNLEVAVKHADEEVRRLEFWSDVKEMAEKGVTKGALDEDQGWDDKWAGLDRSGPADVISNKNAIGTDDCPEEEGKEIVGSPTTIDKEKGKANE